MTNPLPPSHTGLEFVHHVLSDDVALLDRHFIQLRDLDVRDTAATEQAKGWQSLGLEFAWRGYYPRAWVLTRANAVGLIRLGGWSTNCLRQQLLGVVASFTVHISAGQHSC
ncbi:MAG: hypothetical protein CM15mP120_23410 [Pseudomonadota bacterium]|nr:MAG: hypothetical protein CM15mP120_23410 [Pseudomonadota bacterium]